MDFLSVAVPHMVSFTYKILINTIKKEKQKISKNRKLTTEIIYPTLNVDSSYILNHLPSPFQSCIRISGSCNLQEIVTFYSHNHNS